MLLHVNVHRNELPPDLLALKRDGKLLHLLQGRLKMLGPHSLPTEPCEGQRSVTEILDLVSVHVARGQSRDHSVRNFTTDIAALKTGAPDQSSSVRSKFREGERNVDP